MKKLFLGMAVLVMVIFGSVPVCAAEDSVNLVDMHEIESDRCQVVTNEITDSYGKTYSENILKFDSYREGYIIYDLNGSYEQLSATLVCSTETETDAKINVGIFADGKLVYELKEYTRQKPAQNINLDVSGVGELAVKTLSTEGYGCDIFFVDSSFAKADKPSGYPECDPLNRVFVIDSKNCSFSDRLFIDTFGNVHNEYSEFECWREGYVLYNLGQQYESFSGCIVSGNATESDNSMNIKFYLDDELVYSQNDITKYTAPINFDIDVKNGSVLKIITSGDENWDSYLYVTDGILKAHDHIPGDWITDTPASCTEDGQKTKYCTICNKEIETEIIPAEGHKSDGEWITEKEAACTEDGERVQYCSVCDEICDMQVIPAPGHTSDEKWEVIQEPTCSVPGEEVQHCSVCGAVVVTKEIETTEHTLDDWTTLIEESCDHEGIRVKYCSVCGEIGAEETIPVTNHKYGKWTKISGSIWNNPVIKTRTCSVCGWIERKDSNATKWVKPLVKTVLVIIFLIVLAGGFVLAKTRKK